MIKSMFEILRELDAKRAAARAGGGEKRVAAQHAKGKLTASERVELLLDPGSFGEYDVFVSTAATISAWRLDASGRRCGDGLWHDQRTTLFVFSQDFTVFGGSLSEAHAEKICKVMDHAVNVGAPVIGLNDSGGARIRRASPRWAATPRSFSATWSPRGSSLRSP